MKKHKYLLIFIVSATAIAAPGCGDTFSDGPTQESVSKAFKNEEIQRHKDVEEAVKSCQGTNAAKCLESKFEEALRPESPQNQAFLKKLFKKPCLLGGGPHAALAKQVFRSYAINASISLSTQVAGYFTKHAADPNYTFPIGYVAQSQLFAMILAEQVCRNKIKNLNSTDAAAKKAFDNFVKSYLPTMLVASSTYMAAVIFEEYMRGEDITSPEKIEGYLREGALAIAWDIGTVALNAAIMDKIMIEKIPQWGKLISQSLQSGVLKNAKWIEGQKLLVVKASDLVGTGSEVGIRWFYYYLRSLGWQSASHYVRNSAEEEKLKVEEKNE